MDEPGASDTQEEALFESDDPAATENEDYEWIKHLKPMNKVCDEAGEPLEGWFRLADVMPVMPLNILCKTVDITEEVSLFFAHIEFVIVGVFFNELIAGLFARLIKSVVFFCYSH